MNDGGISDQALMQGGTTAIPPGATGLMTSFSGVAAGVQICREAGATAIWSLGNVRTVNRNRRSLEHVLAGAAFGALTLASPAMAADLPLKAPHFRPAFDWSGFYIGGHTGYSRGSSSAVLSDPLAVSTTGSVFSGVIGGVQGGYNVQMPPACCSASKPISPFRTISPRTRSSPRSTDRALRRRRATGLSRHRARPHRLRQRALAGLRHRRLRLCRRALYQYARRSAPTRRSSTPASAGPPAPVWNTPSRRTGACGSNISTASSNAPTFASPRARSTIRRSISSRSASASTARSTGRDRQAGRRKPI